VLPPLLPPGETIELLESLLLVLLKVEALPHPLNQDVSDLLIHGLPVPPVLFLFFICPI